MSNESRDQQMMRKKKATGEGEEERKRDLAGDRRALISK